MTNGEPTIVPQPEIVYPALFTVVARFHCPLGCGWWHDEPADPGAMSLILPVGYTHEDVSSALSLNAEARELVLHNRVEQALSEHYRVQHPHR
jgi:hypothetical protein